jgi:N-acetylglucosaminyl-diphospho-decaprenol L-rhamnosyltransferase
MVADEAVTYDIVIVSYRSGECLSTLLPALQGQHVIVVDNAAGPDAVRDVALEYGARYVDVGQNVGFAKAANIGAAASQADVLIFLNPDCLPSESVLNELARSLSRDPALASCAPRLVTAGGATSNVGGGWAPTVWRCIAQALGMPKLFGVRGIWIAPREGTVLPVDWLAGTCLAVRRLAFEPVGGFDTRYFLYNEDMALGERLRAAGLKQLFRADLTVEHAEGQSAPGATAPARLMRGASMARFLHDYNPPTAALAMQLAIAAGWTLRAVACALTPKRRDRVQEFMTYVVGVLRPAWATQRALSRLGGD